MKKDKDYMRIVFELLQKDDLKQQDIFEKLSFRERVDLFVENAFLQNATDLKKKCNNLGIFLFTEEEFEILAREYKDLLYRNFLMPHDFFVSRVEDDDFYVSPININFSSLSDDERKNLINKVLGKVDHITKHMNLFITLFSDIKDDNFKDEFLTKLFARRNKELLEHVDVWAHAVSSFDSDDLKEKWLPHIKRNFRYKIIASLKDDSKKVRHLFAYSNMNRDKSYILSTIKDQDVVRKLIRMPLMPKVVIQQLEDEIERESAFRKLFTMISNHDKGIIVASFSTREKQLELSKLLKNEVSLYNLIRYSEELENIDIFNIAINFRSDERKIEAYQFISDYRLRRELCKKINNPDIIVAEVTNTDDLEISKILLSKLSDGQLIKLYNEYAFEDQPVLALALMARVKDKKWVVRNFEHITLMNNIPFDLERFTNIFGDAYHLNKEHLREFATQFGYGVFKYIKNSNIREAINLDDESFKKYIQLFHKSNFSGDEKNAKNFLFAFAQQKFKFEHPEVVNRFAEVLHLIDIGTPNVSIPQARYLIYHTLLKSGLSDSKIFEILGIEDNLKIKNPLDYRSELANLILEKMKNHDNEAFRTIVWHFIDEERRKFATSRAEREFSSFPKGVNEKAASDYYVLNHSPKYLNSVFRRYYYLLGEEELDFIDDIPRLTAVIEFKRNPGSVEMTDTLKKDLRLFGIIVRKMANHNFWLKEKLSHLAGDGKIDFDFSQNPEYIFSVLQEINPKQIKEKIFSNPEEFKALIDFLSKTKLIGVGPLIADAASSIDIILEADLIASLINNFSKIKERFESEKQAGKKIGLVNYLVEADYFDSESYRYEYIFGKEIFRKIKNNPEPNKAPMSRQERIENGLKLIREVDKREKVAIPPQDKVYTTSKGKKLNVKVGDLRNLGNLVLGELTGACMRIGGAGKDLFEFCLLKTNGFHMVFTDSETGDFVSRVSGFRNGNTVFFNQLKNSVSPNYNNEDLIEIMKQASEYIIEQTKSSNLPVDNVVVSTGYAAHSLKPVEMGEMDIKKGLGQFYSDVACYNAALLASSAGNGELVPIVLNSKTPQYDGLVETPRCLRNHEAIKEVKHLISLSQFLDGKSPEEINIRNIDVAICYATSSWAIYMTKDGKIDMIIASNNKKVIKEAKAAAEQFKAKLKSISVEEGNDVKSR